MFLGRNFNGIYKELIYKEVEYFVTLFTNEWKTWNLRSEELPKYDAHKIKKNQSLQHKTHN